MPPPRLPPTPSMSGELIIKDKPYHEGMESFFSLPPAALTPSGTEGPANSTSELDSSTYCPASPTSPELVAMRRNPNPLRRAGTKRPLEDFDLPPPPTRARKIIQMKPKAQSTAKVEGESKAKEASKALPSGAAQANSKKKQPSATSAAGRKIARKTAHSLIERRRRSKMNEEFGTLKDMIPACNGQEMHKLAILQASIDYVNYLEQCISDLKTAGGTNANMSTPMPPAPPSPTSPDLLGPEELGDSAPSSSASPELLPNGAHVSNTSPSVSPRGHQYPAQPAPEFNSNILPSPALGPSRSPEISTCSPQRPWMVSTVSSFSASPIIQPQRNSVSYQADDEIDHEASAALLMLNMDRRGTMDSMKDTPTSAFPHPPNNNQDNHRKMGMSVRDLLIS